MCAYLTCRRQVSHAPAVQPMGEREATHRPIRSRASSISCCGLESGTGHSSAPNAAFLRRDAANFCAADASVVTVRRARVFAGRRPPALWSRGQISADFAASLPTRCFITPPCVDVDEHVEGVDSYRLAHLMARASPSLLHTGYQ